MAEMGNLTTFQIVKYYQCRDTIAIDHILSKSVRIRITEVELVTNTS